MSSKTIWKQKLTFPTKTPPEEFTAASWPAIEETIFPAPVFPKASPEEVETTAAQNPSSTSVHSQLNIGAAHSANTQTTPAAFPGTVAPQLIQNITQYQHISAHYYHIWQQQTVLPYHIPNAEPLSFQASFQTSEHAEFIRRSAHDAAAKAENHNAAPTAQSTPSNDTSIAHQDPTDWPQSGVSSVPGNRLSEQWETATSQPFNIPQWEQTKTNPFTQDSFVTAPIPYFHKQPFPSALPHINSKVASWETTIKPPYTQRNSHRL